MGRLRRYFETNNDNYIAVYNQGVCGDNSDDLLDRFEVECAAREPQIIIFAIGTNDSQYINSKDNPRVSLERFKNNLMTLVDQAKKFSDQIIFVGLTKVDESKMMPVPWAKEKFYDNDNITRYNSVIEKVCQESVLPFINLLDLLDANDLHDGLHPNSKGHEKMFIRIRDFLVDKQTIN